MYVRPVCLYGWQVTLTEQQWTATVEALYEITRFAVRQLQTPGQISLSAAGTLAALESSGPSRLTDLASREGITQPSMTAMVSRLERQGLVERRHDPSDGRIVLVAITDAGKDTLRRRRAGLVAFLSGLMSGLDPAEQQALANAAPALRHMTDPTALPAALAAAKETMDQRVEKSRGV
jgi:DNA-binding MarR family transcriptional regulator